MPPIAKFMIGVALLLVHPAVCAGYVTYWAISLMD